MSAPRAPAGATTATQLYDVINGRGLVLLLGVTRYRARRAVRHHQAGADVHPQWRGAIRIEPARRGAEVLEWLISYYHIEGKTVVLCRVERLLPSGLTVAEMFDLVRPGLEAAVLEAARSPAGPPAPRPVAMGMDLGADPSIELWVHDPVACAADMARYLGQLQGVVERVIAGRAGSGL